MQLELAELIIDTLNLEIAAEEIVPEEALFGDSSLGLDSIDALELALVISKTYGIELKSDDAQRFNIFANLAALTEYVGEHRQK
jgi:acyl carrier protein